MTSRPLSGADFLLLANAILATLQLVVGALAISLVLGVGIGLIRQTRSLLLLPVRAFLTAYAFTFRSIPMLIQMLFLYYGIGVLGFQFDSIVAASIALSAYGSSSMGEIVRSAIASVPPGQVLAAQSLGMSATQCLRYVVAPQAVRVAIPPTVGFTALLVKATALASVLGFVELTRAGSIIDTRDRDPLTAYLLVGLAYFALVLPVMIAGNRLERRLHHAITA